MRIFWRKKRESRFAAAEEHARAVFSGEDKMQEKISNIFRTFRERSWKNVGAKEAEDMVNRHILNADAEELRMGIRYAEVLDDPRATLGQILLYKAVGSEEHAKKLKEIIRAAKDRNPEKDVEYHVGLSMFAHQRVNRIPDVGTGAVAELLLRWHGYDENVARNLAEILGKTEWHQETRALAEKLRRTERARELKKKGASEEMIEEIEIFLKRQKGEQGKAGPGKDALIWRRRGKRASRRPR